MLAAILSISCLVLTRRMLSVFELLAIITVRHVSQQVPAQRSYPSWKVFTSPKKMIFLPMIIILTKCEFARPIPAQQAHDMLP